MNGVQHGCGMGIGVKGGARLDGWCVKEGGGVKRGQGWRLACEGG